MRIPRVNAILPVCMLLVMALLCYVIRDQEKTIAAQQLEIRALYLEWSDAQEIIQTPCEQRDRDYRERNNTLLTELR